MSCCKPKQSCGAGQKREAASSCCGPSSKSAKLDTANSESVHDSVKEYYGKTLQSTQDLKTDACCTANEAPSAAVRGILSKIHDEVASRYYGCGLVMPEIVGGCKVLDLGSGSGRDVYTLSALVGEQGHVTGVDMTQEQLDIAIKYKDYHAEQFGFKASNVSFVKAMLETMDESELKEQWGTYDVIVSNCVLNLVTDKPKVLADTFKLLKPLSVDEGMSLF